MRWDRFFDDLEDQLASEWEAERAALDSEAERLRLARVPLRDRLAALLDRDARTTVPAFEMRDGTTLVAAVSGLGADWVALAPASSRAGAAIAPLAGIVAIGLSHVDLLHSARPPAARSSLSERMTLGFALRDLSRRRISVAVHLTSGRVLAGTIDRAGADHLDLALHDPGTPRRAGDVTGYRIVPFDAVAWLRLDAGASPV